MDFLQINRLLDPVLGRLGRESLALSEAELLKSRFWDAGEDILLRQDFRFKKTAWGNWTVSNSFVANEFVYKYLREHPADEPELLLLLEDLAKALNAQCVFCPADPRMVLQAGKIRLAASELSNDPYIEEDPGDLQKFTTHLPVHTLRAVAASEPINEWGPKAQEQHIETLGWIKIEGKALNERMFVARIQGHSMDDGKRGIKDKRFAIFELWPAGDRKDKIILARGSINDPETGFYALKRYTPEPRDKNRERNLIRLESLNQDKEKYPDLVITATNETDFTIVAEYLFMLEERDFARKPRKLTAPGSRDISSASAHEKIAGRLHNLLDDFFAENVPEKEKAAAITEEFWTCNLVCLSSEEGTLCIEAGPLKGMPGLVKKLEVNSGDKKWFAPAGNFRDKCWRINVAPSNQSYVWNAPGFEDLLDEELQALETQGISISEVTYFKVDADGIGRKINADQVSIGQTYRLIIPPGIEIDNAVVDLQNLENDWRFLELLIDNSVSTRKLLEKLGIKLANIEPTLKWVVNVPTEWRQNLKGQFYPCFTPDQKPVLQITADYVCDDEEAAVFLAGNGRAEKIMLNAGNSWLIELPELKSGHYLLEVLFQKTRVVPARVAFKIIGEPEHTLAAGISVKLKDESLSFDLNGHLTIKMPLDKFFDENPELCIDGPPFWPSSISAEQGIRKFISRVELNAAGELELEKIVELACNYKRIALPFDLLMDFREAGLLRICIDPCFDSDLIGAELKKKIQTLLPGIKDMAGNFSLIKSFWLAPITKILNYQITEINYGSEGCSHQFIAFGLNETTRDHIGKIRTNLRRILVLTMPAADMLDNSSGSLRSFANSLCWQFNTFEVILTDGLKWLLHKRNTNFTPRVFDLSELATEEKSLSLEEFIHEFAVGV